MGRKYAGQVGRTSSHRHLAVAHAGSPEAFEQRGEEIGRLTLGMSPISQKPAA